MAKRKNTIDIAGINTSVNTVLLVVAIAILAYIAMNPGTLSFLTDRFQFAELASLETVDIIDKPDECSHYNLYSEYLTTFGHANMDRLETSCESLYPGGWTGDANEVSCYIDSIPIQFICPYDTMWESTPAAWRATLTIFQAKCESLNANFYCQSDYFGCMCLGSPEEEPEEELDDTCSNIHWIEGDKHDCLAGTCPFGTSCEPDMGTGWCTCLYPNDCGWHYQEGFFPVLNDGDGWWDCYGDCAEGLSCDVTEGQGGFLDCTCIDFNQEPEDGEGWDCDQIIVPDGADPFLYCGLNGVCGNVDDFCEPYENYLMNIYMCGCTDTPFCGQYCYIYDIDADCECPPQSYRDGGFGGFWCVPDGRICDWGGQNLQPGVSGSVTIPQGD